MLDNQSNNKRIAKNTIYLYFRTLFVMIVSLYTSRIILQALGIEDFGIYNVVAGITAIISFLNGTLADATQRFITFELGKKNARNVNKIFSTCLLLHFFLAVIVAFILEPTGIWFISNRLQIPEYRLNAAQWIFQFTIIQLFISFISVPYNALIIAHEKMSAFAMISVVEVMLRLCIAFTTMYCGSLDKLIIYGLLLMISQFIIRFIYVFYCERNFNLKIKWNYNNLLIREIGGFAVWTIIGNMSYVCVTQGLNLLLGVFFMPVINAARGVAVQVQTAVNTFVKNFQTAINPQITKSYASNNVNEMQTLMFRSSRFSYYLLALIIIPVILETDIILRTWLADVPPFTATFLRLILISSLINSVGNPLAVACKATGNIKHYELYSASIKLLILPTAYLALRLGTAAYVVFIIQITIEFFALLSNIYITSRLVHFSKLYYFRTVVSKIMLVSAISLALPCIIYNVMDDNWIRFFVIGSASVVWTSLSVLAIGLSKEERQFILKKIKLLYGK